MTGLERSPFLVASLTCLLNSSTESPLSIASCLKILPVDTISYPFSFRILPILDLPLPRLPVIVMFIVNNHAFRSSTNLLFSHRFQAVSMPGMVIVSQQVLIS